MTRAPLIPRPQPRPRLPPAPVLWLKRGLKAALPWLPGPLDRACVRGLRRLGLATEAYRIYVEQGRPKAVPAGPFAGMMTLGVGDGSAFVPKVFGSYEKELWPGLEGTLAAGPDRLINIGAAEGFYSVGCALRLPDLRVIAFESEGYARGLLRRQARLNGVEDRIVIRGSCDAEGLEAALSGAERPWVICDCEGCENAVLDPELATSLRRASIIVELHDCFIPGTEARMRARFQASHQIERVAARPRAADEGPSGLSSAEALAVMDEARAEGQAWLVMRP